MRPKNSKNKKKKDVFVPKKIRMTKQLKKRMIKAPRGDRFGKKWFPYNN